MDTYNPAPNMKYSDALSDLVDLGIEDVVNIYSLPVELLATFGSMGVDGAERLRHYAHQKLLKPLGLFDEVAPIKNGPETKVTVEEYPEEVISVEESEESSVKEEFGSVELVVKEERASDNGADGSTHQYSDPDKAILRWLGDLEGVSQVGIEEEDNISSAYFSDSVRGGVSSESDVTSRVQSQEI